jgi:hypothetical protein
MAYNTEIITAQEVMDFTTLDLGFDIDYFTNYILSTQRKYVKGLLGKDYYDEILTQVAAASLTADNTIIVDDFLKPMLAHYVIFEVMPAVRTQFVNQGAMSNDTEFSDSASSFDYSGMRNFFSSEGDLWKYQTDDYIKDAKKDDSTKYPLYQNCDDNLPQTNKRGFILY